MSTSNFEFKPLSSDHIHATTHRSRWTEKISQLYEQGTLNHFVLVYHAHCLDGSVAAAMMEEFIDKTFLGAKIDIVAAQYGTDPLLNSFNGKHVVMVDFSYPIPHLHSIAERAVSFLLIDHHITITKKLSEEKITGMEIFLSIDPKNETDSGASLVYKFLGYEETQNVRNSMIRRAVTVAREQDLWLHDGDPTSDGIALSYWFSSCVWKKDSIRYGNRSVLMDMTEHEKLEGIRLKLFTPSFESCLAEGHQVLNIELEIINHNIAHGANVVDIEGITTLVVKAEKKHSSLTASILNEHNLFSATYFTRPDGDIEYSLRSSRKHDYDVGSIAKRYGGGGHRRAAGFVSKLPPSEVFKPENKPLPVGSIAIELKDGFLQVMSLLSLYNWNEPRFGVSKAPSKLQRTPRFEAIINMPFLLRTPTEKEYFTDNLLLLTEQLSSAEDVEANASLMTTLVGSLEKYKEPVLTEIWLSLRDNHILVYVKYGHRLEMNITFNTTVE